MGLTRRVSIVVKYGGDDISKSLEEYISKITITDNFKDSIDDVSLSLRNDNDRFLMPKWALEIYQKLEVTVITENWKKEDEGRLSYPLGSYNIDSRDFSKNSVSIKALAIPLGEAQDQKNSKSWTSITMSDLGKEMAKKHNLKFKFMSKSNPKLTNLKQEKETDFSFLKKIITDEGAVLKIAFDKLIIFDEEKFEKKAAKFRLSAKELDYRLTEKTKEVYDAIEVTYINPQTNKTEKIMVTATTSNQIKSGTGKKTSNPYGKYFGEKTEPKKKPKKTNDKILKLNRRSKSEDLEEFARKKLKKENTKRVELSFSIVGDMGIYSGDTFDLYDAGIFDGKYLVNKIVKNIPGFKFSIDSYLVKSHYKGD